MISLNEKIHGFVFDEKKHVEEINADVYTGRHVKSGARIMYVAAADENKVFSISFKTVPENDTGVMHILEHSVLNGSDKYPVREPFVELLKGSMQTFLNAMTYPDKTMYPVASCNEKDFENLMDVYLDAVFHPAIYNKKEIFLQEGWHYEGGENECFRGVVYNEMKGEMSNEDSILGEVLQHTLFPDICYSKNSGGDPEAITSLTYEEFIETHKKFYHPENSYIYLYGSMDIPEKLRMMDEGYLSFYDRINADVRVGVQKDMGRLEASARYDSDEDKSVATHYALGYKAAAFDEHEKLMAIEILLTSIAGNNEAPLKKALLDEGICEEMWAYLDDQLISPYICMALKRCSDDDEKIKEAVERIITRIAQEGIDKQILEANINQMEFKMREADFGNMPAGLVYCTWVMASWLYGGDPVVLLSYEKEFTALREAAKGDYFEKLIEELFLRSEHSAFVKLVPDKNYAEEKAERERARVCAYREKLGEEGLRQAEEELESLKMMQNSVDSEEALAAIPVLDLRYINPECEKLPFEKVSFDGSEVIYHELDTKKILYMSLYFDCALPYEQLQYASFATRLMGRTATESMSAAEVMNRIKIHLGMFSVSLDTYAPVTNRESVSVKLRVSFSALGGNVENAVSLVNEIITKTRFDDTAEIKKMILQEKLGRENWMTRNGHSAALRRVMSYFSPEDKINQHLNGIDYYFFIKELANSFTAEDAEKMKNAINNIVCENAMTVSAACDRGMLDDVLKATGKLALDKRGFEKKIYEVSCIRENEGFMLPCDVAFAAKAANSPEVSGSMFVLSHIMTYDYLWNTIRAKGGAYGTGFTVNLLGDCGMYSYRDPNLKATVEAFDEAYKYLEEFDANEREMTKYIVGSVAASDRPKSPFVKAMRSDGDYFNDISMEMRNRIRREMLETTAEDIRNTAPLLRSLMEENNLCVFSSKAKIEKDGDLFKNKVTIK